MANKKLDIIADKKLETIALQNKSFKPITGAYPKMVNGKKTKRLRTLFYRYKTFTNA